MMTFAEYVEMGRTAMPSPAWLNQATAASLAAPGKEDTRRAIERARKLGRPVTHDELRSTISPESQAAAKRGIMKIAAAPLSRDSGSTSGPMGFAGSSTGA